MKSPMKKNYIVSCLICIIAFFSYSYASCVFGADKMSREEEYIVTINGIKMYNSAAINLLNSIIREEKGTANIVDESTEKSLDVAVETLKSGISISIDKSKNMEYISKLFEGLKEHATKSPDNYYSYFHVEPIKSIITSMKIGNRFCLFRFPSDEIGCKITLCINDKIQVVALSITGNTVIPSETQKVTPIHE